MLRQFTKSLAVETKGRGLIDITQPLMQYVANVGPLAEGLLTVFVRHTSASLLGE